VRFACSHTYSIIVFTLADRELVVEDLYGASACTPVKGAMKSGGPGFACGTAETEAVAQGRLDSHDCNCASSLAMLFSDVNFDHVKKQKRHES